jgi:hypothetical protein
VPNCASEFGSSRIRDVIRPLLMAGTFLITLSVAGFALAYDPGRGPMAVQVAFLLAFFPSLFLIIPYMGSIVSQAIGAGTPVVRGVGLAAVGSVGFSTSIGLALAVPQSSPAALLGLVAGMGLLLLERSGWPTRLFG